MIDVELACPAENIVGESLVWDDRTAQLWWVDLVAGRIHSFDPVTGVRGSWEGPGLVTSLGLTDDGGFVVGLEKSIAFWRPGEAFQHFVDVEPQLPGNRLNEGVVGPDGAFWVGTMQNNVSADGSPLEMEGAKGALYRVTRDGRVQSISKDQFGITNTLVWPRPDLLVTADTLANEIYAYDINPATSVLVNRRTILHGFPRGLPDGSCLDAEGHIWNCRVAGGACLVRLSPDGRVDRVVDLPCSWPTSCTFGGPNLDTLFVTSARFAMTEGDLAENPQEGGLFSLRPGASGNLPRRMAI